MSVTDYGFVWGPMEVQRIATIQRSNGVYHILEVKTNYRHLEICVSPSGLSVRAFLRGKGELKA